MRIPLAALILITATAHAQWTIQDSHTTADLRGIHSIGNGIAWASGTNGTILRTTDDGATWQHCSIPPGADNLDFRGIQVFDANTAIVMSSGKGDLSRLYRTNDGCNTWKLVFINPDKTGSWAAIHAKFSSFGPNARCRAACGVIEGNILGDPVEGKFVLLKFDATGSSFPPPYLDPLKHKLRSNANESISTESNSAFFVGREYESWIATIGDGGGRVIEHSTGTSKWDNDFDKFIPGTIPIGGHTISSGVFSIYFVHPIPELYDGHYADRYIGIAVGGDYKQPDDSNNIAAYTADSGRHWSAAQTSPHGYRSSVTYEEKSKTWITVGPNGTDISTDDGRNWRALKPNATDAPDADKNWNALSLPFVVGPNGRIGKLRSNALQ